YDTYAPTAPTVPCGTCGGSTWHRAGDGWSCSTCHPVPSALRPSTVGKRFDELGERLLVLAEHPGWPKGEFKPPHLVGGSGVGGRLFAAGGLPDERQAVLAHLDALPTSEGAIQ